MDAGRAAIARPLPGHLDQFARFRGLILRARCEARPRHRGIEADVGARIHRDSLKPGAVIAITKFSFPTSITFGPGARTEVAAHLKSQGVKRPLVVTDKGLASLPILKEFTSSLAGLAVSTYSGVFGNPVKQQV